MCCNVDNIVTCGYVCVCVFILSLHTLLVQINHCSYGLFVRVVCVCSSVCIHMYLYTVCVCIPCLSVCLSVCVCAAGVVFDSLEGEDLEYTLRLRHEVGGMDTWHTHEAAFWLQAPGARVTDK